MERPIDTSQIMAPQNMKMNYNLKSRQDTSMIDMWLQCEIQKICDGKARYLQLEGNAHQKWWYRLESLITYRNVKT